jgi:hypothetical protein
LDLGQASEYSALVVDVQTARGDPRSLQSPPILHHQILHLKRWLLGTAYTEIVRDVRETYTKMPLVNTALLIDRTGVGRGVYDMFRESGIHATVGGWSITAGRNVGDGTVPKRDLVAAVQVALGERRLEIAPTLPLADTLAKELELFRVRITDDNNDIFSSIRKCDHDDLVFALAIAVWSGERQGAPTPGQRPYFIKLHG